MTQKELLYFEDAIGHETNIISICKESLKKIDDENILTFINKEITKHENIREKLINFMRGKVNE